MKILISILGLVVLVGCNQSSDKTREFVEYGTDKVESEVADNLLKDRMDLESLYLNVITKKNNKHVETKKFYTILKETLYYIDTIKAITSEIGTNDLSGVDEVKRRFIDEGLADSVLNRIASTYMLAEKYNSEKKSFIEKSRKNLLNEPDIEGRKMLYFSNTTPQAATWTLIGFEEELVKLGKEILIP